MWLVQHFLLHSMPYANSTFNIQTNARTYNYTLSPKPKKNVEKKSLLNMNLMLFVVSLRGQ